MRKHSASARSAYSLVEMVFVIGLGAVLMSVLAILVTQVLAANTTSREHAEGITIIGSLAEQFRRDVHSASAIDRQAGPPERLQISRADGTRIDYEIIDGGVRRDELRDGQVTHRETYLLRGMRAVGWNDDFRDTGEVTLSVGRLVSRTGGDVTMRDPTPITATLAHDRRTNGTLLKGKQ